MSGRNAYHEIAAELDPTDPQAMTLDDLDPELVREAADWAQQNHKAWPPHPAASGWQVTVWSVR